MEPNQIQQIKEGKKGKRKRKGKGKRKRKRKKKHTLQQKHGTNRLPLLLFSTSLYCVPKTFAAKYIGSSLEKLTSSIRDPSYALDCSVCACAKYCAAASERESVDSMRGRERFVEAFKAEICVTGEGFERVLGRFDGNEDKEGRSID